MVVAVFAEAWALPRMMTKKWGSGDALWNRMIPVIGEPDVAFGGTDGIPEGVLVVDLNTDYDWNDLPFKDDEFELGYWDPPYEYTVDKDGMLHCGMYKPELKEIWRCCKRLAVLHTMSYPTSWFERGRRTHHIFLSFGPLKAHRALQVFEKSDEQMSIKETK